MDHAPTEFPYAERDHEDELILGYRERLAKLLLQKSYREGDFTLSSGKKSDYYFDCRVTALSAEGAYLIGNLFFLTLKRLWVSGVAGMSIGADPLVTATTYASQVNGHPLDGLLVRKESKGHGTNQFVEGLANFEPGARIAVIDDVVTSGGSLLKAYDRVKDAGLVVNTVACILDREEGGRENIREKTGLELVSLFTRRELKSYA